MRKMLIVSCLTVCLTGVAQAGLVTFTFDDLNTGETINHYMTRLYDSTVTVSSSTSIGNSGWPGNGTSFLWSDPARGNAGGFEITFEQVPVRRLQFDAYVFKATGGADFTFTAFNLAGNGFYTQTWDAGVGGFNSGWIDLAQDAYLLRFSNNGKHDVAIDNLVVPLPPSLLLGVAAVGLAGRKLRALV